MRVTKQKLKSTLRVYCSANDCYCKKNVNRSIKSALLWIGQKTKRTSFLHNVKYEKPLRQLQPWIFVSNVHNNVIFQHEWTDVWANKPCKLNPFFIEG